LSAQESARVTAATYRVQHQRVTLLTSTPAQRKKTTVWRWGTSFVLSGLLTLTAAHLLVESCDLRFCQPFRHEHMAKVRFFQVEVPEVDVVYLGSSQVHLGVMPPVIAQMAAEHGVKLGPQYNLAVPGAELEVSYILARDTLKGPRTPRLLVLGLMPVLMAT